MKRVTRAQQKAVWEREHLDTEILPQLDTSEPSSGVKKFAGWLKQGSKDLKTLRGLEVCCGKGRNVIWLAQQGAVATGIDFSSAAIKVAERRARAAGVEQRARFVVQDATEPYPLEPASLDFAVDCFGSTDIESLSGRRKMLDNLLHVLKPGGYLMIYLLSTDDEYYRDMSVRGSGQEPGSFVHHLNGKYEKSFSEDEIRRFYSDLTLCVLERVPKQLTLQGKTYANSYIWAVFQKPE